MSVLLHHKYRNWLEVLYVMNITPLLTAYPWRASHWPIHSSLVEWLYLADVAERPEAA